MVLPISRYLLGFVIALLLTPGPVLAQPLDYADTDNWAIHPAEPSLLSLFNLDIAHIGPDTSVVAWDTVPNKARTNTGVDIFYVYPTQDTQNASTAQNMALQDQPLQRIKRVAGAQAGQFARWGRFYAPYYRQANVATFNLPSNDTQAKILAKAYGDVAAAFQYYLDHHNSGNRIILAAHSQGSQMLGLLLTDFFDSNPQLRDKLVAAVLGGFYYPYVPDGDAAGGHFEHIPMCSEAHSCGCYITWRSYKRGQNLPAPPLNRASAHPAMVDSGWVHTRFDTTQHTLLQDTLLAGPTPRPLPRYIESAAQHNYNVNAGFVAFDSLYSVRLRRETSVQAGLTFAHTPAPNDLRPNPVQSLENSPLFGTLGYHQLDYALYLDPVLQQLQAKLDSCSSTASPRSGGPAVSSSEPAFRIQPNPVTDYLRLQQGQRALAHVPYRLYDATGRLVRRGRTRADGRIKLTDVPPGLYLLRAARQTRRLLKQ